MPYTLNCKLVKKEVLKTDILRFSIESKEIAETAKPGQFLEIKVSEGVVPFLRRPISIHNIDKENNIIEFIFQIKGEGTKILAKKEVGDLIDILGPLGNGIFEYEKYNNISIIGGGIGVFPLYELAKEASEKINVNTYLGFRNKDFVVCEEEFKKVSKKFVVTTDDGTYGEKGFAIDYLKNEIEQNGTDCIYACGPLPMLKAVQKLAMEKNIPCQVSLEQLMGCGVGVCLGCAVPLKTDSETKKYERVCKEGPVFDAYRVEI